MTTDLQRAPARSLSENEEVIERGRQTFIDVGNALMEIREGRQYRDAGYTDFDTYCRERWGWSRRRSDQMIEAASVAGSLPVGTTVPTSEGQARPLAPLRSDPEALRETWQDAQRIAAERAKPVTQAIVQEAVDARREDLLRRAKQNGDAARALAEMTDLIPIEDWVGHHQQISESALRHVDVPRSNATPTDAHRRELQSSASRYTRAAESINAYLKGQ